MKQLTFKLSAIAFGLVLSLSTQSLFGQGGGSDTANKSRFSLGLGLGYGRSFGDSAEGDILFSAEPGIDVSKAIRLGIRFQHVMLVRGTEGLDSDDFKQAPISSLLLSAKLRLLHEARVKPFAGVGAGWYHMAPVSARFNGGTFDFTGASDNFAGNLRAGIDVNNFFVSVEYNVVPETKETLRIGPEIIGTVTVKNNFLAFTVGYTINGR